MNRKDFQDLVRLTDSARRSLVNQLKRQAAAAGERRAPGRELRKDDRWDYQGPDLAVTVEHPGGSLSRFLVMPRNLSAGGLAFLHGGYLHCATKCKIVLPRIGGPIDTISGVVTNCRHVDGRMHEVCVKFDRRIDPMTYLNCASGTGDGGSRPSIELPDLHGSVLYIEDSEADNRLLQHHLRASGIQLKCAADGKAALELLALEPFDIILCDMTLGAEPGEKIMAEIRRKGFVGPIVAVSAESSAEKIKAAQAAGANDFLAKPYEPDELYALMTKLHQVVGAVLNRHGTFSSMQDQASLVTMIEGYITQVRTIAQRLKESVVGNDLATARSLCLNLKGSASGYGFEVLAAAAADALKAMDAATSLQQATRELRVLRLLCEHVAMRPAGDAAGGPTPPPTKPQ